MLRTFQYGVSFSSKTCVVMQTLQATSCPVKVMTSRFDSDSPPSVTSCDDSVSSSLLRIAHANSSDLSFLMSLSQQLSRSPLYTTIVLRVFHTRPDHNCNKARPIQYEVATLLADIIGFTHRYAPYFSMAALSHNSSRCLAQSCSYSHSCSSAAHAGSPAQAVTPLHVAPTDYIHHITPCQHFQMIPTYSCTYRLGLTFGSVVLSPTGEFPHVGWVGKQTDVYGHDLFHVRVVRHRVAQKSIP